mmetsp:Transcript_24210/g.52993  ORF Transcript_24210/g.52993 Transcript_24210/m.52993 type:complete len:215 (+) Transcript_24210:340-984(+)
MRCDVRHLGCVGLFELGKHRKQSKDLVSFRCVALRCVDLVGAIPIPVTVTIDTDTDHAAAFCLSCRWLWWWHGVGFVRAKAFHGPLQGLGDPREALRATGATGSRVVQVRHHFGAGPVLRQKGRLVKAGHRVVLIEVVFGDVARGEIVVGCVEVGFGAHPVVGRDSQEFLEPDAGLRVGHLGIDEPVAEHGLLVVFYLGFYAAEVVVGHPELGL